MAAQIDTGIRFHSTERPRLLNRCISKLPLATLLVFTCVGTGCNFRTYKNANLNQQRYEDSSNPNHTKPSCCETRSAPTSSNEGPPAETSKPGSAPSQTAESIVPGPHSPNGSRLVGLVELDQVSETPAENNPLEKAPEKNNDQNLSRVESLSELNERVANSEKQAPSAQDENAKKWASLLEWVSEKAQTDTSSQSRETFLFIEEATPQDREKDHVNRGVSLVGGFSEAGQFGFARVQMLIEHWTFNEKDEMQGILHHFVLDRNGRLVFMMNKELVKTRMGRVLKDHGLELSQKEAETILSDLKQYWFERMEKSKLQTK